MKKLTYLFLLTAALFISCEKDGIEGPNLNDLFGELNIIENFMIVGDSASFVSESAYFTAKFSKIVDWKISITGLSSGAEKIIIGKSANPLGRVFRRFPADFPDNQSLTDHKV